MINSNWNKSSYSTGGNSNCVECRGGEHTIQMRDTQNRDVGHLSFSVSEWKAFLADLRTDRL